MSGVKCISGRGGFADAMDVTDVSCHIGVVSAEPLPFGQSSARQWSEIMIAANTRPLLKSILKYLMKYLLNINESRHYAAQLLYVHNKNKYA